MSEVSVYKQMTAGTSECLAVIKNEIGLKITCQPFAIKVIEAMKTLKIKTQQEALDAANILLSGLQTLYMGGICAEDYDKIDFVNRGNRIVPSARVEAFLRASARKGYRITDTIVAVPQEDKDTTYFKEIFYNGDIVYSLEDKRINTDREVTAKRLVDKYFNKFICRLDVHDIPKNQRVAMVCIEMTIDELIAIASASEQGLYKSYWEEYQTQYGAKKRKVVTDQLNDNKNAFWIKWTCEMVNKSVIRRALKRLKEVLPELKETIFAFEQEDTVETDIVEEKVNRIIDVPDIIEKVDLKKLSPEQQADCDEMFEIFKANPKMAEDKFTEIMHKFKDGEDKQQIINKEYPSIVSLMKSTKKRAELEAVLNA